LTPTHALGEEQAHVGRGLAPPTPTNSGGAGKRLKSPFCKKEKAAEPRLKIQKRCISGILTKHPFMLLGGCKKEKSGGKSFEKKKWNKKGSPPHAE
jgi:hypothetical protein